MLGEEDSTATLSTSSDRSQVGPQPMTDVAPVGSYLGCQNASSNAVTHLAQPSQDLNESGTDTDDEGMLIKQAAAEYKNKQQALRYPQTGGIVSEAAVVAAPAPRIARIKVPRVEPNPQPVDPSPPFAGTRFRQQKLAAPSAAPAGAAEECAENPLSGPSNNSSMGSTGTRGYFVPPAMAGASGSGHLPAAPRAGPRRPAGAITLKSLVQAGILVPGEQVLSVEYKSNVTWGGLNEYGQILFSGLCFDSPSAFSVYIKRLVNPTRKADDGWKAIKYAGRLLEQYKEVYLRLMSSDQTTRSTGGTGASLGQTHRAVSPLDVGQARTAVVAGTSVAAAAAHNAAAARKPPGGGRGGSSSGGGSGDREAPPPKKRQRTLEQQQLQQVDWGLGELGIEVAEADMDAGEPQLGPSTSRSLSLPAVKVEEAPDLLPLQLPPDGSRKLKQELQPSAREQQGAGTGAHAWDAGLAGGSARGLQHAAAATPLAPEGHPSAAPALKADIPAEAPPSSTAAVPAVSGTAIEASIARSLSDAGTLVCAAAADAVSEGTEVAVRSCLEAAESAPVLAALSLAERCPAAFVKQLDGASGNGGGKPAACSAPQAGTACHALPSGAAAEAMNVDSQRDLPDRRAADAHRPLQAGPACRTLHCGAPSAGCPQPFKLRVYSSALVAMDLHAHLSSQPVHGLLGGVWDEAAATLTIVTAAMVKEAPTAPTREGTSPPRQQRDGDEAAAGGGGGGGRGDEGAVDALDGFSACGMRCDDGQRVALMLRGRGLACIGRYTSRPPPPPAADPAGPLLSAEPSGLGTKLAAVSATEHLPAVGAQAAASAASFTLMPLLSAADRSSGQPSCADVEVHALFERQLSAGLPELSPPCVAALLHPYQNGSAGSCSPSWFQSGCFPPGPSVVHWKSSKSPSARLLHAETTAISIRCTGPSNAGAERSGQDPVGASSGPTAVGADTVPELLASELQGLVGALATEYGGRPGAQAFLSGPAWEAGGHEEPGAAAGATSSASTAAPSSPPSRLQHVVASAVVLLPEACREAFTDMVLGALVTGLQLLKPDSADGVPAGGGGSSSGAEAGRRCTGALSAEVPIPHLPINDAAEPAGEVDDGEGTTEDFEEANHS